MNRIVSAFILLGVFGADSRKISIGFKATLPCDLHDVTIVTWYQQRPGEQPVTILSHNIKSVLPPTYCNGFSSEQMSVSNTSLLLVIENSAEVDCVAYYCAKKENQVFEFGAPTTPVYQESQRVMEDDKQDCQEEFRTWKYAIVLLLILVFLFLGICLILCVKMKMSSKSFV